MASFGRALLSCLAYGIISIAMTLCNKSVAVVFNSPWGLIFVQNAIQTVVLCAAILLGIFSLQANLHAAARVIAPLNVLFVGMLYTSMQALQRLPVPVVTVLKNCGNGLIVLGDWYLYNNRVSYGVVAALVLVFVSAVLTYQTAAASANTEAEAAALAHPHKLSSETTGNHVEENALSTFSVGVLWMCANLLCTASYSLYARAAKKKSGLTPSGMSFVNGMLSLPVILFFSYFVGGGGINGSGSARSSGFGGHGAGSWFIAELPPAIMAASMLQRVQLFFSGVLGCMLGACVFWCISETSPTTLSFVGALNKLPLAILGALFFGSTTTNTEWFYIVLNVTGSLVYVMAKAGLLGASMSKDVCGPRKRYQTRTKVFGESVGTTDMRVNNGVRVSMVAKSQV